MRSRADAAPSFVVVPGLSDDVRDVRLSAEESHYLARVCRAKPGDRVTATDGRGARATLRIESLDREAAAAVESLEREPRARVAELWCGAPEAERGDWLVEKLAELGIARLVLLETERGEWRRSEARRTRWERLALAALRQSRQLWRMEIAGPLAFPELIPGARTDAVRLVARPDGGPLAGRALASGVAVVGVVGPAPGLTAAELAGLEGAGFASVSLGPARLRAETAALALAAWWAVQA